MRRVSKPLYWTDYPFVELGDTSGMIAPVRECEVLSYDGDKYVRVKIGTLHSEIKRGYVYMEPGRCGEVSALNRRVLSQLPQRPTRSLHPMG